jgi:predicted metal-dependent HD superfamily phosphohydrolase
VSIDFDLPHTQGYLVAHVNRYGTYSPIDGLICLDVMQAVASLIRSTDHFQASSITHPLKAVMLGADLAILGQSEGVYAQYKHAYPVDTG